MSNCSEWCCLFTDGWWTGKTLPGGGCVRRGGSAAVDPFLVFVLTQSPRWDTGQWIPVCTHTSTSVNVTTYSREVRKVTCAGEQCLKMPFWQRKDKAWFGLLDFIYVARLMGLLFFAYWVHFINELLSLAACDQFCETCYSDQPRCLTCASDKLLHDGKCISECPDGYFPSSNGRCRGKRHICMTFSKALKAPSTCCLLFPRCLPGGREC